MKGREITRARGEGSEGEAVSRGGNVPCMGGDDITHQVPLAGLDGPGEGGAAAVEVEAAAAGWRRIAVQIAVIQGQFGAERLFGWGRRLDRALGKSRTCGDRGDGQQQNECVIDPESHEVSSTAAR